MGPEQRGRWPSPARGPFGLQNVGARLTWGPLTRGPIWERGDEPLPFWQRGFTLGGGRPGIGRVRPAPHYPSIGFLLAPAPAQLHTRSGAWHEGAGQPGTLQEMSGIGREARFLMDHWTGRLRRCQHSLLACVPGFRADGRGRAARAPGWEPGGWEFPFHPRQGSLSGPRPFRGVEALWGNQEEEEEEGASGVLVALSYSRSSKGGMQIEEKIQTITLKSRPRSGSAPSRPALEARWGRRGKGAPHISSGRGGQRPWGRFPWIAPAAE